MGKFNQKKQIGRLDGRQLIVTDNTQFKRVFSKQNRRTVARA